MKNILLQNPITAIVATVTLFLFLIPEAEALIEFPAQQNSLLTLYQTAACHLLHWSPEHLFWDLGMFVVIGGLCERMCRTNFVWTLAASAILIPPLVAVFHPELTVYRGLSGIDTALFGLAASTLVIQKLRQRDGLSALIFSGLIVAMIGKIGYELVVGQTLFVDDGSFLPVPLAHVVGASVGLLFGILSNNASGQKRFGQFVETIHAPA